MTTGQTQSGPRSRHTVPGDAATAADADEMNLTLAQIAAHSDFTVSYHAHRTRPRWELRRKNGAEPGLYCLITDDISELAAAFTSLRPPTEPAQTHTPPRLPRV